MAEDRKRSREADATRNKAPRVSASSAKCDLTKMTVTFVSPTELLSKMEQRSIPASSLKLNKHFAVIEEWEKNDTKEVLENVTAELQRLIFDGNGQPLYFMAVAKCKWTIYDLLRRLLKKSESDSGSIAAVIRNEAMLRYAIGDPLVNMLCDLEGLKVVLEESVSSGASSAGEANPPSQQATPSDYSCYTLRSQSQVLAVVIEAKMGDAKQDAVAQVMGYVAAFTKTELCPPVAIVLTESHVHLLLFPFVAADTKEALLRAAIIKFDLWKEFPYRLNSQVLYLIGGLVNPNVRENIIIDVAEYKEWEKMRLIKSVTTTEEHQIVQLQHKVEEMDKEIRCLTEALARKSDN